MINIIHSLNYILPGLYLVTFLIYALDFKERRNALLFLKRIFLFISLISHLFYLFLRIAEFNHPPITNKNEIFTVLAFSIAFSYFVLELVSKVRGTGMFIIAFSFLFQFFSTIFIQDVIEVQEILRNKILGFHVISALLGYSGFTMAAVYGVLFLILYKKIKLNKYGLFFDRLPSLETLESLSFYSVVIGFILLSIAMTIGIIWLPSAFPDYSYFDPKLISTTVVWVIFGTGILVKTISNWYGKKVIHFYLVGYAIALISMFLSNILSKSFHVFY